MRKSLPRTHSDEKSSCKVVSFAAALIALLLGKHIWPDTQEIQFPCLIDATEVHRTTMQFTVSIQKLCPYIEILSPDDMLILKQKSGWQFMILQ
jgi:hypothetical protein